MIKRPWGFFEILDSGKNHWVKRLTINSKQRLSLQRHSLRSEDWHVISGKGICQIGERKRPLLPGDYAYIPHCEWHRITNTGESNLVVIEFASGAVLEEDIERKEDDYGRV